MTTSQIRSMDISLYQLRCFFLLIFEVFGGVQSTCILMKASTGPIAVNTSIDSGTKFYDIIKCRDLADMLSTPHICREILCSITFESINRTISSRTFTNLSKIYVLDLSGLKIENIQAEAFTGLTAKKLQLQRNILSKLPARSFVSIDLEHLDVSENSISAIEDNAFLGASALNFLDLSDNNLTFISENVFHSLDSLKMLNISHNSLTSPNLRYICHIKTLNILIANRNNFIEIPACFAQVNLSILSISENKLSTLGFALPKSLRELYLRNNYIEELHSSLIEELKYLQILDISHNEIAFIPKLSMNLKNLRIINLSSNKLSILNLGMFDSLHNLQTLNVSINRISELPMENNSSLGSLRNVDISRNNLESIDMLNLLKFCPRLNMLKIDSNEFSCSKLTSILYFAKNRDVIIPPGEATELENINGIACSGDWIIINQSIQSLHQTITELKNAITQSSERQPLEEKPDHIFSASINNNLAHFKNKLGEHKLFDRYSYSNKNKKIVASKPLNSDGTEQYSNNRDGKPDMEKLKKLSSHMETLILGLEQLRFLIIAIIVALILFCVVKIIKRMRRTGRGSDCSSLEMPMLQASRNSKF